MIDEIRDDQYYMKIALELAQKGEGYTSPNPMVGSVVVKDGEIIGQGYHQYYGGPHAEVYALDQAGERAEGATIYVTLEPCSHYGKTPPCSVKVVNSGVKKAVIAMTDPNPLVAGRGIKHLEKAGIEVKVGILEKEAKELNEPFVKFICTDRPFVYLKSAQTLDGFLATRTGDSKWITNEKARLFGHKLRHKVDAILVGIGTVINDDPSLTTRLPDQKGKDSTRIILDARLEIPLEARLINQESEAGTIIVTGEDCDLNRKEELSEKKGVDILTIPLNAQGRIPLDLLLKILHDQCISSILVEGGGRVNYSFLKAGLVDKIYSFIAPKILGGNDGISMYAGEGPSLMSQVKEIKDIQYQILDDNILLIGKL
ncbi:MAG: bifunctional diaminohydroxyphosphoribosylaminopyrimidine deaminase/5-amino-6-(5-phosphoribosylamino)uracil reductase RibD [Halanaerobiales bacterium]